MKGIVKFSLTFAIILIAIVLVIIKYWDYVANPWTRDGQVQAQVIQIAPRVTGPIIKLPIQDNQLVKSDDLLFEIDPSVFAAQLEISRAQLKKTRNDIKSLEKQVEATKASVSMNKANIKQVKMVLKQSIAEMEDNKTVYHRQKTLISSGASSRRTFDHAVTNYKVSLAQVANAEAQLLAAEASLTQSQANLAKDQANLGESGEGNARLRLAKANVKLAELNLTYTKVLAPVDGNVTNLNLRKGTQAVANQPALALVDINSFWVSGFFRENIISRIQKGDQAVVTLMSYPDNPIKGRVESLGWGIAQDDGSTGESLLPNINPTFEWIRLAQRVPVLINLTDVPKEAVLRVGTTASVLVMTGTHGTKSDKAPIAAPRLLE